MFECVELNSSFYHLPLEKTISGWTQRTSESFRFCPKLSRLITHQMQLVNTGGALKSFFSLFEGMKSRLGPVLIQFPPQLSFDRKLISGFFNIIRQEYNQYRIAVEVRNRSFINDDFLELLSGSGMAFVIADSGGRYPYTEAVTSDIVYLRFHGREKLYASDYSDDDLGYYSGRIAGWLEEGKEIWAFFNNDFYGFAVKNALRLMEMTERIQGRFF
jgi:uncharacterized protein YecE (DUF72 family)